MLLQEARSLPSSKESCKQDSMKYFLPIDVEGSTAYARSRSVSTVGEGVSEHDAENESGRNSLRAHRCGHNITNHEGGGNDRVYPFTHAGNHAHKRRIRSGD